MQRLRLTVDLPDELQHPVQRLERQRGVTYRKLMLYWNLFAEEHIQILFHVEGDRSTFDDILAAAAPVLDHETVPVGVDSFYALTTERRTPVVERFGAVLAATEVVPLPPVEFVGDGSFHVTFVGDPGAVRALLDRIPPGVSFEVEQLTRQERPVDSLDAAASLTPRQREAVAAAVEHGYYAVPREGSVADVAEELDCAPSTASNHLRKAEAAIMSWVV